MSEYSYGCGAPYLYDHINVATSVQSPSTAHSQNAMLTRFFARYLIQRAFSQFKWNIPEQWQLNYMLYCLYFWGFFAVVKTDKYGVIPQGCSLSGYGVMYQPTHCVITNPLLRGIKEPRIGVECSLIRLQPDYGGMYDLVSFYADMLSLTAEAAGINIQNAKLAYVFIAESKTLAESFKKLYDRVASGEGAVVADKKLFSPDNKPLWETFSQELKGNYIAGEMLNDLREWEKRFDAEIGLPTSNTEKKERLVTKEINANAVESYTRCDMWLETLKKGCKQTNDLFGTNISVEWRINPMKLGGEEGATRNDKPNRTAES